MTKITILMHSDRLGYGDDNIGEKLTASFLRKLWMLPKKPDTMIFYNTSVKLLAEGSPVLDAVDALSKAGVDVIACGTCVDYFHLEEKIRVGRVSSMDEIASIMMNSTKVITP